jgi:hypothetical protein
MMPILPLKMPLHWRMQQDKLWSREDCMATIAADAVRQFNDEGYYAPIRALTSEEAADLRRRLEDFEATNSGLTGGLRNKAAFASNVA